MSIIFKVNYISILINIFKDILAKNLNVCYILPFFLFRNILYNEFENLNIFEVSKNASNFFNLEKNYNDGDILKFFTPKNIKNNYKMIENNLSHIGKENIVIDSLKYEENKLH